MDHRDIEELAKTLGKRLRFARLSKGYTLNQLAAKTGIDKSNLSRAERGKAQLRPNSLSSVIHHLGVQDADSITRLNVDLWQSQNRLPGIGSKIRDLRQSRMITLTSLAFQANIDPGNLSRIESGKTQPSQVTIDRVCKALNVKEAELLATPTFSPIHSVEQVFLSREQSANPQFKPPLERIEDPSKVLETGVDSILWQPSFFRVQEAMPIAMWLTGDILVVSPQIAPAHMDIVLASAGTAYFPIRMRKWKSWGEASEEKLLPELLFPGGLDLHEEAFDVIGVVMQVRRWLKQ